MKTSTRVLAWLYISVHLLVIACAASMALLVTSGHLDLRSFLTEFFPRLAPICDASSTLASAIGIFSGVLLLLSLTAWICLLKKREWAWWLLMMALCLSTLDLSTSLMHRGLAGILNAASSSAHGHLGAFSIIISNLITIAVLAFDRPSRWRGRSGTKRRRRRRLTKAKPGTKTRRRTLKKRQ